MNSITGRSSQKSRCGVVPNRGKKQEGLRMPVLNRSDTVPHVSAPPPTFPCPLRNSKSDAGSENSEAKHLVDYSTKRASYNNATRSSCRGPVISRLMMQDLISTPKSISARDLDWTILSSAMNTSKESEDEIQEMTSKQGKNRAMKRGCSARLRLHLAKSLSTRNLVDPSSKDQIDVFHMNAMVPTRSVVCPSTHRPIIAFRRPSARVESQAA